MDCKARFITTATDNYKVKLIIQEHGNNSVNFYNCYFDLRSFFI